MVWADTIQDAAEGNLYADEVILARTTPYQRIVLTAWKDDLRLFLNSNLQFSSRDEYRYHEALVHPGLAAVRPPAPGASPEAPRPDTGRAATARPASVLVLGGGDGLAVRELLRHPSVGRVTLVDLDGEMTRLFTTHPELVRLNGGSLKDPRVTMVTADAFQWLETSTEAFDFAVVDFPDPSNFSLGKLYTTTFYRMLARRLTPEGAFVVQATSPLFARKSFWCIVGTIEQAGLTAAPYHAYVPSFGEWGFVLASKAPLPLATRLPDGLRFLTVASLPQLFTFADDMARLPVETNRLSTQALVRYYEDEWRAINR
jgi:spermidine synthase